MKLIIAIVRPERLEALRVGLREHDLYFMTVSEVLDFRADEAITEIYRSSKFSRPPTKYKLEIAVEDDRADEALAVMERAFGTGANAAGKAIVVGRGESVQLSACACSSAAVGV